ncbi:MAG: YitT family protein [Limnochordaceae bacterium]|uniref:YitT family protein n=1 Tax=Carboxydichorda subterranea TaxID=3109565 RepID=A0ABZ1C0Q1_9FIRM|nr:YitT family protein [Limnochorda sp. L945t]MBE3598840.1 YitT family protein [Limnochordaceae bacterium]WRP17902.1 YitT family protein [Limnochorda sp. L945t]
MAAKVGRGRRARELGARLLPWAQIALGSLITALAVNLFLVPFKLADGGIVGIAVILHHRLGLPVAPLVLALNVPIFLAGWRVLGLAFIARTFFGVASLGFFIQLTRTIAPLTHDVLLATLYAGAVQGIGLGIVLRAGGSTGGNDTFARIVARKTRARVGQIILYFDLLVLAAAAVSFGPEQALYAAVTLFLTSRIVDFILEGQYAARAVMIVSDRHAAIAARILTELERGATLLEARGAYTGVERPVVLCVVSRDQVPRLRAIVHEEDEAAFMVMHEAAEVLGEGFTRLP